MMTRTFAAVAALSVAFAVPAAAQTIGGARGQAVPATPQSQPLGGPLIPGVCLLSREAVFAAAAAGRAASARLQGDHRGGPGRARRRARAAGS